MKALYLVGLSAAFAASAAFALEKVRSIEALDAKLWERSEWISAVDAPVFEGQCKDGARAADGASWFVCEIVNEGEVKSAKWMTTGLGVYELFVNGDHSADEGLKPGFTHPLKTRRSFTYDVTCRFKKGAGERNYLAAVVTAGWWRDKIVNFAGKKSAFRAVLEVTFADGSTKVYGTNTADWKAGVGGPWRHAAIFDGEEFDARVECPFFGHPSFKPAERNDEFKGEILPSEGGEIDARHDKRLDPVEAYVWKGVDGADEANKVFGRVHRLRDVSFRSGPNVTLAKGETLVVDFGQNCAAEPGFIFKAAPGTVLTCLPAEMLNDANGERSRGNDGPAGSVYRANLRCPGSGMRIVYTFGSGSAGIPLWNMGGGFVFYVPSFTFFGYRYLSITATDDVEFRSVMSMPITSIKKEMELGKIETGDKSVNKLISNVYWGQLSNYLSVPTDCPQRNERLGWTADTQVFCEAGAFNADTRSFFRKWMRDMRDSQDANGGFPGVAPFAQYGNNPMRLGWADAGVVVPYKIWLMFADKAIVDENWDAMERFMARVAETKYRTEDLPECGNYQWNDWLSLTKLESCPYKPEYSAFENSPDGKNRPKADALLYWDYMGGCYWLWDARMMAAMAAATGRDAAKYEKMAGEAKSYLRGEFLSSPDGMIAPVLRGMQTPALFALKLGLVEGEAKEKTLADLKGSFAASGGTFHTGFLGTSIIMDTLTENGLDSLAYDLLLNHSFPGWLYSVDQGATTIWERWNSYTKDKGFGPVGMNSFNHYAYGAVLAWLYKTAAGIAPDPSAPGFAKIVMAPKPDRRLGYVKAEYRTPTGLVRSAWRYEGAKWIWDFEIPSGATADVTLPGETATRRYTPGTYHIER